MTILGAVLAGPDHAIMWADTEIWANGSVHHVAPKMTVNAMLCAIGCGTGDTYITGCADRALRNSTDPYTLPGEITAALRTGIGTHASKYAGRPRAYGLRTERYYAALSSPASGRVLLWEFDFARYFEPVLQTQVFAPHLEMPPMWRPKDQAAILSVARRQMCDMRDKDPQSGARGGLTIAEVRHGGVQASFVPDFDADEDTRPAAPLQIAEIEAAEPAIMEGIESVH